MMLNFAIYYTTRNSSNEICHLRFKAKSLRGAKQTKAYKSMLQRLDKGVDKISSVSIYRMAD